MGGDDGAGETVQHDSWLEVRAAIAAWHAGHNEHEAKMDAVARLGRLTPGRTGSASEAHAGAAAQDHCRRAGVSLRPVESRRKRIFTKMGVDSLPALFRKVLLTEAT